MTTSIDTTKKELTITLNWYDCNSGYCILMPHLIKKLNELVDYNTKEYGKIAAEEYKDILKKVTFLEQEMKQIIVFLDKEA